MYLNMTLKSDPQKRWLLLPSAVGRTTCNNIPDLQKPLCGFAFITNSRVYGSLTSISLSRESRPNHYMQHFNHSFSSILHPLSLFIKFMQNATIADLQSQTAFKTPWSVRTTFRFCIHNQQPCLSKLQTIWMFDINQLI